MLSLNHLKKQAWTTYHHRQRVSRLQVLHWGVALCLPCPEGAPRLFARVLVRREGLHFLAIHMLCYVIGLPFLEGGTKTFV